MSGKFFSKSKGTRIGMVSLARETKAPGKMTALWEKRWRGKGREEGRVAHGGDLTAAGCAGEGETAACQDIKLVLRGRCWNHLPEKRRADKESSKTLGLALWVAEGRTGLLLHPPCF